MTNQYHDMEDLFTHLEDLFDPYENDPRVIFKYRLAGSDFWPSSQRIFFLALIGSETFDLLFEPEDLKESDTIETQLQEIITEIENAKPLELNPDAKVITNAIEILITHNNIMPYDLIKVRDIVNQFQSLNLLDTESQGTFRP